jgi:hypothetical protein
MRASKHLRFVGASLATVLLVAGCGGGDDKAGDTAESSVSTTTEDGMTTPGTALQLGQPATVAYPAKVPDRDPISTIEVTVTGVKKGSVKDLSQFTLPDRAKNSGVYYVSAVVKNVGKGNLSGRSLVLYGKASDTLVVPPVRFGSTFARCDYQPFGKNFTQGKQTKVCMVMLVPDKGTISDVQWRGPDNAEPISWPAS